MKNNVPSANSPSSSFVIDNLKEAVTLSPLVRERRFANIGEADLGRVKNAYIVIESGLIKELGSGPVPLHYRHLPCFDAKGGIALPGLVDAHTHPIFAGTRSHEFCMRLNGATYQDIAAAGGGILSTVTQTRSASAQDLQTLVQNRLTTFAKHGVTTVEMKSGYGLSVDEELRHLRILNQIAGEVDQTLTITCLAMHAVPRDQPNAKAWGDLCAKELLPIVAEEKLAHAVDAFVEAGYFSVDDCETYFATAQKLGLGIRIHADEFSDAGAAACAARFSALSADHLQFASDEGIRAMGKAGVTALLLPGTSLYTSIPYTDARPFLTAGCAVGLATDFNPGSCPVDNLRLVMTMGALHCKLSMAQAIAAVTWVPAGSLRVADRKGALAIGMDADILLLPLGSAEEFVADLGRTNPTKVFARGKEI